MNSSLLISANQQHIKRQYQLTKPQKMVRALVRIRLFAETLKLNLEVIQDVEAAIVVVVIEEGELPMIVHL